MKLSWVHGVTVNLYHTVDVMDALYIVDSFAGVPRKVLRANQALRRRPFMIECDCSSARAIDSFP